MSQSKNCKVKRQGGLLSTNQKKYHKSPSTMNNQREKPLKSRKDVKNMTKEQLEKALQRKAEGNAKALKIVEDFTEQNQTEEVFMSKLFDLNQSHYQDIVEERAILKRCGYALCDESLGQIPKKQFHISTVHNRVFDITERKNFCSNHCFKSSNYIKEQLLTSPLWMRDTEKVPDFKLLSQIVSGEGITGNEINLGHARVKKSDIEKPDPNKDVTTVEEALADIDEALSFGKLNLEKTDTSKSDKKYENGDTAVDSKEVKITNNSNQPLGNVSACESERLNNDTEKKNCEAKESTKLLCSKEQSGFSKNSDNSVEILTQNDENVNSIETSKISPQVKRKNENNLIKEITEAQSPKLNSENCRSNDISKGKSHSLYSIRKKKPERIKKEDEIFVKTRNKIPTLESNLKQWISIETLRLLQGDSVVQNALIETNKHLKQHRNLIKQLDATENSHMSDIISKQKASYDRYAALCRKLNMLELVDQLEDSRLKSSEDLDSSQSSRPMAPVPDYDELKRHTEEMMIVVNDFYKGDKRKVTFSEETLEDKEEGEEDSPPVFIPTVDLHAQKALRRKILLDKLIKIFPEILRLLGASHVSLSITSDLRSLVRTFNLTAHNVMVEATEWSLVAVVLLKMLSLKDEYLRALLETDQSRKHLTLICLSYGLDLGYLERLLHWLLEPHHVIASSMLAS